MKNNNKFDMVPQGREHYRPLGIFDPFFDDFFDMPMLDRHEMHKMNNIMKTDVKESEKDYTLEIELPGIDKKDVNIDLRDGYLTISAKREHKQEDQDKKAITLEENEVLATLAVLSILAMLTKKTLRQVLMVAYWKLFYQNKRRKMKDQIE